MIELIKQTERTTASEAYLASLAAENALLRERAQRAEAELEAAREWSAAWKRAATEWRQAAREAQAATPAGIPVIGTLSAQTTLAEWAAYAATVGVTIGE